MAADRRRAAATATTGAGLSFAGGVLRHQGVTTANEGEIPSWRPRHPLATHPARALARRGAKGRGRYVAGAVLGLTGAPALAVGGHDLVVRRVKKAERRSFIREGLEGTADATQQRIASAHEAPPKARAVPLAIGAGSGALGSLAAHRVLDRTKTFRGVRHGTRAGITATAGAAAASASFPLARRALSHDRKYEVTPAGVRRRRTTAVRPSSKGTLVDQKKLSRREFRRQTVGKVHNPDSLVATTSRGTPRKVHWRHGEKPDVAVCGLDGAFGHGHGPFAEHYGEITCRGCKRMMRIAKADDYLGRRVSPGRQRAAIYAAGATPLVGPVAAGHAAARFAPPGHKRQAGVKQAAGILGGGAAGALGGAYGAAALAERSSSVRHGAERLADVHGRATERVNRLRPVAAARSKMPKGSGRGARAAERALRSRAAGPISRQRVAAGVGAYLGAKVGGFTGSTTATSSNLREQRHYNLKHPVNKSAPTQSTGMSVAEQRRILERERKGTHTQTLTSTLGLAGAAMGTSLLPGVRGRLHPVTAQRVERAAIGTGLTAGGISGVHGIRNSRLQRKKIRAQQASLSKAERREPLTRMRADQAAQIVRRHGDAGPLPNTLSRPERMQAYEARYVHAGGHKAEHWQRRADVADKTKTAGLAGATAGGVGILALRHPKVAARLGSRVGRARHAADSATIGAATVSGAGELYAGHARRKRSSYSNSKAGVAASALRRMRDYQS